MIKFLFIFVMLASGLCYGVDSDLEMLDEEQIELSELETKSFKLIIAQNQLEKFLQDLYQLDSSLDLNRLVAQFKDRLHAYRNALLDL